MTASRKPRLTISLDTDTMALLERLETFTGLSPAQTIQKLFPSHQGELFEYLTWLEQLPKGPSLQNDLGPLLIHSYGPDNLFNAIKRIDPTYLTDGEKLAQQFAATIENRD